MPVLRQVPRSEVTDETVLAYYDRLFGDRDPVAEPGTATGTPGDWWTVFALAPDIFKHAVDGFGVYRHPARKIDPVLRELGQTRAGWVKGSQFVFSQHCKSLRGLGASEEKIASIAHWKLKTFWDDEQIFEFTYITCLYDMHAIITRALKLEFDNREEPIVEIAAPEGFDAADFLSAPASKE